ncbi:hypothetical protein [Candidatus Palauibacter irciniicola]|uniref:hypothetical protein n=1 Tax=Candidatus Palauibacter irciniicola TaxID=3056733 RepID=UPI003B014773
MKPTMGDSTSSYPVASTTSPAVTPHCRMRLPYGPGPNESDAIAISRVTGIAGAAARRTLAKTSPRA